MVADFDAVLGSGDKKNLRSYSSIGNVTSCRSVQWTSNIYVSVVFGRVGGVLNVLVLFHSLLWKAKLGWECLSTTIEVLITLGSIEEGFHHLWWSYETPLLHYTGVSSRRYFLSR